MAPAHLLPYRKATSTATWIRESYLSPFIRLADVCRASVSSRKPLPGMSAVEAAQIPDVQGQVDHERIGRCLHQIGYCLAKSGKMIEARSWYERGQAPKRKVTFRGA